MNSHFKRGAATRLVLATVAALTLGLAGQAQATTISVGWNPQTFDVINTDFNDATMTFAGISVQSLDSVTGGGFSGTSVPSAYYHDHGANTTVTMDVRLNGIWTNVFTHSNFGSANQFIATNFGGNTFGSGIVTGVRLLSNPNINQTFHGWSTAAASNTTQVMFNFTQAVPEPATALLLGLGLVGLGLRRRNRA